MSAAHKAKKGKGPSNSSRAKAQREVVPTAVAQAKSSDEEVTADADLPLGWQWKTVGEMTKKMQYGSSAKTSENCAGVPVLRMGNIKDGNIVLDSVKYLPKDHAEFPDLLLKDGDILFNRTNSAELVGKSAVYRGNPSPCSCASYLIRVQLHEGFVPEFVAYFINSARGRSWISSVVSQQVGQANVNGTKLKALSIPVPAFAVQQHIVAEIEKQFTRRDAGVAALKRAQANLKRYRAAVLKAACEGKLVPTEAELAKAGKAKANFEAGEQLLARILTNRRNNWHGRGKYREPVAPETAKLGSLPEGWVWARLEQLSLTFGGLTKNPKRATFPNQLPYLRVANVYANELRLGEIEYIGVEDSELDKLLVRAGDLLIVEGNGSKDQIGRLAIWDGSIEPCVHQNHLIKVRPVEPRMPKWILHFLQSPLGRHFVELVASSTTGLYTLSVSKVGDLPIALPPLAEQAKIVAEVERRLSVVDELDAMITVNLQLPAARLRQSILQKAFEGKL